jgi:hypothetical protein
MARERLYLFDTTLRDGAQTNGVDFTAPIRSTPSSFPKIASSTRLSPPSA